METLARLCGKLREGDAVKFIKEIQMWEGNEDLDWRNQDHGVIAVMRETQASPECAAETVECAG